MLPNILIVVISSVLLFGLLCYEKTENSKRRLQTKTVLSLFFIIAALVQSHPIPLYYQLVLIGLIFCMVGDVFLALPQEKMFLFGLISFLFGHIFYIIGFFHIAQTNSLAWAGYLIIFVISGVVFLWLKPHLGSMKLPVLIYVIVITIMLSEALAILCNSNLARPGRLMVFFGALLFYLSDLFVAKDRFFKHEFFNRLIGLPLYYTGQFLIAFSVGVLNWQAEV